MGQAITLCINISITTRSSLPHRQIPIFTIITIAYKETKKEKKRKKKQQTCVCKTGQEHKLQIVLGTNHL